MASELIDPNDIEALRRRLAELEAERQSALAGSDTAAQGSAVAAGAGGNLVVDGAGNVNTGTQNVDTKGGAVNYAAVKISNGHFIGRDFVHIVNQNVQAGENSEEAQSVVAHYLHALASDLVGLKLGAIDTSIDQTRHAPLELPDIYVPLDTTQKIHYDEIIGKWVWKEPDPNDFVQRFDKPVSALDALCAHRQLTLLGRPGSGKSTFGASVLLAFAQAWQGRSDALAQFGNAWTYGVLLPVRVVLRQFAERLPVGTEPARAGDLWSHIARDLDESGYGLSTNTIKYIQRIARTNGALIVLDGLDECGSDAKRERVNRAVDELMRTAGENCRFVLTARPYAFPDGPNSKRGIYELANLTASQIDQFIGMWYSAVVKHGWRTPADAENKCKDLLDAWRRPDLMPLAENPLLLTLMATLHTNRGRLPDDRADLYNDSVDLLMLRWNVTIGADKALLDQLNVPGLKLSDLREVLEEQAFRVHEENVGQRGTADIGEDRLVRAFRPLLNNSKDKADVVLDYIEKRAGLLIGQGMKDGERRFVFPHRTFQEFLAACYLAAQNDFPVQCAQLARAAPSHWEVVLLFAARLARAERGASAADELVGGTTAAQLRKFRQPSAADWVCARLAAMQLQEIGLRAINKRERTLAIMARVADWLAALLPISAEVGGVPNHERARLGDVLVEFGDPRFDAQRFHLPSDDTFGFVRIAADPEFRIGTREAFADRTARIVNDRVYDDEINDALTPTSEFWIARYPVTVAQFNAFVDAKPFKLSDAKALWGVANHPMCWVNWYEAVEYCDWLNDTISRSPAFDGTEIARLVRERAWRIDLPSELEWEKAARGGLCDMVFPSGDSTLGVHANYLEAGIGRMSTVGCFPPNGFGLYDMIGNLWEWTRSLWGSGGHLEFPYPYDPNDPERESRDAGDNIARVVRGGSWNGRLNNARNAFRNRIFPKCQFAELGFRVLLRPFPVRQR